MKLVTPTYLTTVSCIALSAVTSSPLAQTTTDPQSATLEEVVVTANKRAESINDVPMSITAVSGDMLLNSGIEDVSDLTRVVPGYTFTKTHDSIPVLSIRGIGYYDNNPGATPAVSVYVDEVPLPFPVMTAGALLDLERVEVLKGPQGTLFGQNSTGGALNFIAAKPLDHFEGKVALGYGRFDSAEFSGYVTGPLSDTLTARFSGRYETASDSQRSYTRNDSSGEVDRAAGRVLLDWAPTATLGMKLTLERWTDKSDLQAGQLLGLAIQIPGCQNPALAVGGTCFGPPGPITQVYPNAPRDLRAADWTPGIDYGSDNRYSRASLRADYEISDAVTLTSITSHQDFDFNQRADADATNLIISDLPNNADIGSFYQELRLSGAAGALKWLLGANYSRDRIDDLASPNFRDWSVGNFDQRITTNNRIETRAFFANTEYDLGGGFTLQAGARYTEAEQLMTGCPADSGNGVAASLFNAFYYGGAPAFGPGDCLMIDDTYTPRTTRLDVPLDEDNVSWRVGLNFRPNDAVLLYANASKGYKAGSFTLATATFVSQFTPATQESVLAYEAGFKIGGASVQLNGATFYYDYTDKQLLAPFDFGPPGGVLDKLQNVPESRVVGAEIETVWAPLPGLQLSLNATYVDTQVVSSFIADSPFGGSIDLKDETFPYAAQWQGLADVGYRFSLGDTLAASIGASYSYRSDSTARFGGGSTYEMDSYGLVDLRAGIKTSDEKYALDFWGRNVTDKYHLVNITTNADTIFAITGQPATYGVRATVRF